jgi:hypothetical protein
MKRSFALAVFAVTLTAASGGTHKVARNSSSLQFSFEWPAEAAAIPKLDLQLYTEAKRDLAEAQKNAAEDQNLARQQKRDFNPHFFSMAWTTAGQTPRLLSLENQLGTFTGGAHPNSNHGSLLWDRKLNREIAVTALFGFAAQFSAITRATYCKNLDAERAKRRGGEKMDLPDFNACPKNSELAIYPVDGNKDGRFDRITLAASPYVAGPYVEGDYEIALPVTPALIAALKPEYRASFEAQRQ